MNIYIIHTHISLTQAGCVMGMQVIETKLTVPFFIFNKALENEIYPCPFLSSILFLITTLLL